ncbi:MAG: elongation factor 4 [Candidatus Delongbacteria bacterium]|nr:elongation factor 4 [Candidatus Delongbacteria bacterium]
MALNSRNFSIIAHIDHGKSTIADRLLELTGTIPPSQMRKQVLDDMELEQERGITIKSHAITMKYTTDDGRHYILNLIDTPGHVDFAYEVSRSLAACEGVLLVVDATQGIEAQTLSNLYLALEHDLTIIPIINKIDLPSAQPEVVRNQIVELLGCEPEEVIAVSAKTGENCHAILETVVEMVPPPPLRAEDPLQILIFDSVFDSYRGVIAYVRVMAGTLRKGEIVRLFSNNRKFTIDEVGILLMVRKPCSELVAGDVGYVITGAKDVKDIKVGDTITHLHDGAMESLPGYREPKPMVFAGLYPVNTDDYELLRDSLAKLVLNDASLTYQPESSTALGFGFRCGFLGLLHMEIIQERLDREYRMDIITTVPNVEYRLKVAQKEWQIIDNPADFPRQAKVEEVEEPYIKASIITHTDYIGNLMKLSMERRGVYISTEYIDQQRVNLKYEFPLSEVVFDFYDRLKTVSRGYASLDYELTDYRRGKLVRLDILLNGDPIDALSMIVHQDRAFEWGNKLTIKLKELIPRQQFDVAVQAAIGSKVIARTNIKALRKNVTAKCYGGDITRKRKLLEKQKAGKKRMKQVGNVEVPQEAFLAMLRVER